MTALSESLPHVLSGERREIDHPKAGLVSYYVDAPASSGESPQSAHTPPLLLVHSINAAASAHEVKPLFDRYKQTRRTYAIDLPGYGHSGRSERTYDQRLMIDAIHAVVEEIRAENQAVAVDALAASLACEFLARAALEAPDRFRSLALVSPTGFARYASTEGPPEADCRRPGVLRVLSLPLVGRMLFRLLTSAPSIRYFLQKTWGSKDFDEEFFLTSRRLSRYPGAHRAPFHFISGYLFSADILTAYKALTQAVWLSYGVRGDFADFSRIEAVTDQAKWRITTFQTGALSYFEVPEAFKQAYDDFLNQVSADSTENKRPQPCLND